MACTEESSPVIRQRQLQSRRRRDGLIRFAKDITSQNGEDGIIQHIFQVLSANQDSNNDTRWCVDVGAWDGVHLSNTHSLLVPPAEGKSTGWHGVLIEANKERFQDLAQLHEPLNNICYCRSVSSQKDDPNTLANILKPLISCLIPIHIDFICIDIDGSDYWALHDLLSDGSFCFKLICIEFNPTMPDDLIYVPARGDDVRHGASLSALVELAGKFGYVLIETTLYNAFFIQQCLYDDYFSDKVPDTSIEALHESTMDTSLYQLYDGTIKLWGCKKLLWHRLPIDESKIQVLPREQRVFPFAPKVAAPFDTSSVVDLSPCCTPSAQFQGEDIETGRRECSSLLYRQLRKDGFCLVRGLGIPKGICDRALTATSLLLQEADESVRRSCLTKDRARRGYSPMNVENFASLIGEQRHNDLVRKFRVGPLHESDPNSALLQPNVWPASDVWDGAASFRSDVEHYYIKACMAGQRLVEAICDGLLNKYPELKQPLKTLNATNRPSHSSILSLLSYRVGSRHKGKNKGPLVAAHTDVGIITMLLFDRGDCAVLQRSDGAGGWVDVYLPNSVPEDPIFVVNIADCFSELCGGRLPSTLHRVDARQAAGAPRNCCALFVGLDPNVELEVNGTTLTYEEWRKRRIARAREVLTPSRGS